MPGSTCTHWVIRAVQIGAATAALFALADAQAEPYLAVQHGLKCMQCHVNPTGGGERTPYGEAFAQNVLPAEHIDTGDKVWTGMLNDFVGFGGDLRMNASWQETRGQDALSQFNFDQTRVYLSVAMIPERLLLYVDEQLAPGTATNREAWAQLWLLDKTVYIKAGQLYLPFGLRLEDQLAFTRQVAGINMTTSDQGFEIGYEHGPWDAQLAISNGTSGGLESNNSKQVSGQLAYVRSRWRIGAGLNFNNVVNGQVRAVAVFAGVRTGPIVWLGEIDNVSAPNPTNSISSRNTQLAGLLEANWLIKRGHNLKLTGEWFDPDRSHDQGRDTRTRISIVYEWTPMQFVQLRGGWRRLSSAENIDALHQQLAFVQLHAFF